MNGEIESEKMSLTSLVQSGCESLRLACTAKQLELLSRYAHNMWKQGEERGLTALKDPERVVNELIIDALGGVQALQGASAIADLGSGGGTPGLPLAIMLEDCRFTLVESQQRKVRWIEEQIAELGLTGRVQALALRIEDFGRLPEHRQQYDRVVAKALASLPVLVELAVPLLRVGGELVAYKGSKFAEEIAESSAALRALKAVIGDIEHYRVQDMERVLVRVAKTAPTPKIYPRRVGIPQHKPL